MTITDFSALSLKLPLLDRGTLSQAWRDALHLAGRESAIPPSRRASGGGGSAKPAPATPTSTGSAVQAFATRVRPSDVKARTGLPVAETHRAVATRTAKCAVRSLAHRTPAAASRTASVITLPNGERLCLVTSHAKAALHVTVLCPAHLRDDVQASLAHLRLLLARRDIVVDIATARGMK